ncbi:MAG: PhnD/SsuA/transferrin family substrate-binding protein [Leptolyngbyaceae cyanobacterium MO_188.B28]|nr:PhnD/SsuA/transferrin family substrate-binding protein [Leptolyngbyaceae cyanobacterium MO_188.B28]
MLPRRRLIKTSIFALTGILGALVHGCGPSAPPGPPNRLVVGLVSYDTGARSVEKYERFKQYLAERTQSVVELEPVYNELRAVEQIERNIWSIVFAPSGLAAIAISDAQYLPIHPLQGPTNLRSVIIVRDDSPIENLIDLSNEVIALGDPGSAVRYYLPLYDLYGLTLSEIRFAPTPRTVLEWLSDETIAAGALAEHDYQRLRSDFIGTKFRVLHQSRIIPSGAVLIGPTVDRNQQRLIETALREATSDITSDTGYIPNAPPPKFEQLILLVDKVRPLQARVREIPAVLTLEKYDPDSESE